MLVQTYIEHLRGEVEDNRKINHHGKELEIEGETRVSVSNVGGTTTKQDAPEETPVVPFNQ